MTTATFPRLTPAERSPWRRAAQVLTDLFEGVIEGREIAGRYDRLQRMSNAELAHLGLTRADIPRAAVNGSGQA